METDKSGKDASRRVPAGSQDSTVHASEGETTRDRRSLGRNRGLNKATRKVSAWNEKATESGQDFGRAVRHTLFRRQRRDAGLTVEGVEFPDLLEAEATPGLVTPDPVLIPSTSLYSAGEGRDPASGGSELDNQTGGTAGMGGDILPPPSPQAPPTARRVASGVVLVAIAIGIGLILSILVVLAVAWAGSTVMDYFSS